MSPSSPVRLCGALFVLFAACTPLPPPDPCAEGACAPDASVETPEPGACERIGCLEANRGVCTPEGEGVRCSCNPGYVEINGACVYDDPCAPNPCTEPGRGTCISESGAPVCECDPDFTETQEGTCVQEEVNCDLAHHSGDAQEPDECPSLATAIDRSQSEVEHNLLPEGDQDWYVILSQPGLVYRIRARSIDTPLSLRVFSSPSLTSEMASTGGTDVALEVRAPTSDPLYIRVRASSPTHVGTYWFSVEPLGFDDHGDTSNTSTALPAGSGPLSGEIERAADRDWFSFTAPGGRAHRLECLAAWPCELRLFDDQSQLLRVGYTPDHLNIAKLAAGRYYVRVQALGEYVGTYSVSHEDLGPDDHSDSVIGAKPLVLDSEVTGALAHYADVDVFEFETTAQQIYALTCTAGGDASVCFVSLTTADGSVVASGQDSVVFEAEVTRDLFVRVSTESTVTGSFSLSASHLGEDLHGDTAADATPMSVSTTPTSRVGEINLDSDVDFFAFTAEVNKQYAIWVVQGSGAQLRMRLWAAGGTALREDDDEHLAFEYRPPAGTEPTMVRYVSVARRYEGAKGPYELFISEVNDAHSDQPNLATFVNVGTPFNGAIDYTYDADLFWVSLTAGTTYTFTQGSNDTVALRLEIDPRGSAPPVLLTGSPATFTAPVTDTYQLRLTGSPATSVGTWELLIQ